MAEVINGEDVLYRRIAPAQMLGDTILPSAFKLGGKPDPNISVDLARLTTPTVSLNRGKPGKIGYALGEFEAEVPFRLGLVVRHDPSRSNYSHCVIEGGNTKSTCRELAKAARIVLRSDHGDE